MRAKTNIMERRVRLRMVNPHIICFLCRGYLIDATTITECLHTFCKSCIVRFLEKNNKCPNCEIVIHQSHPLNYISHDRTVQDIVYKLVPRLQEHELKRQQDFYRKRGLPMPSNLTGTDDQEKVKEEPKPDVNSNYHRDDEQVNIVLECSQVGGMKALSRSFLRLSTHATVTHLKKFIALKCFNSTHRFKEVEVLCNEEILGKDHTLKFVCITRWRYKDIPLKLNYRPKVEF